MTSVATDEFAVFIGLDWADAKHDICLQVAGSDTREVKVLEHKPEAIEAWATALLQRFGGGPIAIALELNKGPIVEALRKYNGFVLFHINPGHNSVLKILRCSFQCILPSGRVANDAQRSISAYATRTLALGHLV